MSDILPIFMASDDNFVPYAATAIASIVANTRQPVKFNILDSGISEERKVLLASLARTCATNLCFCRVNSESEFSKFPVFCHAGNRSYATYNRLLIPKLFPDVGKCLYLDSDIIALGDISGLFNVDLDGCALGAVWHPSRATFETETKELMEIEEPYRYFNAGVLLIDTKMWNALNVTKELSLIVEKYGEAVKHHDETLLNKYFTGRYKILDLCYNYMNWDFDHSICDKIILRHFALQLKPWMVRPPTDGSKSDYPHLEDFWKYARMTPFYDEMYASSNAYEDRNRVHRAIFVKDHLSVRLQSIRQRVRKELRNGM